MKISISKGDPLNPSAHSTNFEVRECKKIADLNPLILQTAWSPIVWRDGRRREDHFESVDWLVFDVDEGLSIAKAKERLRAQGSQYLIAPSRSHQKEKISGGKVLPPTDRFRLILKLTGTLRDLETYKYTMGEMAKSWGADSKCRDGARFFFPSESVADIKLGFAVEPLTVPYHVMRQKKRNDVFKAMERHRYATRGVLPRWITLFLEYGKEVQRSGRNNSCYAVARELKSLGYSQEDALSLIKEAPISWENFSDKELRRTVRSAFEKT